MSEAAQSDATPFFFLLSVRGAIVVVWVVSALWLATSAVEVAAVVSRKWISATEWRKWRVVSVLEMVTKVSYTIICDHCRRTDVRLSAQMAVKSLILVVSRALGLQAANDNAIGIMAASRRSIDSSLQADLVFS